MFEDKKVKTLNFKAYTRLGGTPDDGCRQRRFEDSWKVEDDEVVGQGYAPQKGDVLLRYTEKYFSYLYVTEVYETSDSWRARVRWEGGGNLKGLSRLQLST